MRVPWDRARAFLAVLQVEGQLLRDAFRERGVRYFMRPLLFGGCALASSYFGAWLPAGRRLERAEAEARSVAATMRYAEDYRAFKAKIESARSRMPAGVERRDWLLNAVRESLREQGLVPVRYEPPTEAEGIGYQTLSLNLTLNATYSDLAAWARRLESGSLVFVKDLNLTKKEKSPGMNQLTVTLAAVLPEKGLP